MKIDPATKLAFSLYENPGVHAVLLGSGISRAAAIPTGWEITLDLVRRVALMQGEPEQADWGAWYAAKFGGEPNYSQLLEQLADTAAERRAILDSYIEPTPAERDAGKKLPTRAHRAIARLVRAGIIKIILTTNFDRLMENALRDEGVEPVVVASVDGLAGAVPMPHAGCYLVKLHGDYKDARILNTDAELAGYPPEYDRLLDRVFDEYGLIVCGWSGEWDHALRAAILRSPNRRYPLFWAAKSGRLRPRGEELLAHRRGIVIPIDDADSLLEGLQRSVETLVASQLPNPANVALAVASARRYVAKTEFRIALDDLVRDQLTKVVETLDEQRANPPAGADQKEVFRQYVETNEVATEAVATVAGVLGRWGGDEALELVLDTIRALFAKAREVQSGYPPYIEIRVYPAVLVFAAYALGLARAGRWNILQRFLTAALTRDHRGVRRTVDELFASAWDGAQYFRHLPGMENRKTASSERILSVLTTWAPAFMGVLPDITPCFARFEILASLAHTDTREESALAQGLTSYDSWTPTGLSSWKAFASVPILEELAGPGGDELLAVGFAKGHRPRLDLFIRGFQEIIRQNW
ncbi:SIR2-like protein [Cupriavidus gilardii J11]|uniref:SIR2-like protein n=1 Tax=Cupriavidus gilardii J11 TaxID=936133 RepID=A0A562BS35_9BURK|nr:SIR2 family protein [Cupriavidus gilardii]TWG87954.1 SIR2-like protein [Cupriavidus gilardii J11]